MTSSLLTLPSAMSLLPRDALGGDSESFPIGNRALQAPPTVCLQFGDVSGSHEVLPTRKVRDGLFHMFDRQRSQIWFHNGPFDIGCFLEWYPELTELIWLALQECRVFDTMYLQRMVQIARGDIGGPLALDLVALQYGLPPPTKEIMAEHPDHPGQLVDVRTSFGLWYGAEVIPDPWFSYADYDGEIMLPLAARMIERHCTPKPGAKYPAVRLEDLAQTTRAFVGHHLWRTYGLRVDPAAVSDLAVAAKAAMGRLQEAAQLNGFLKPKYAKRSDAAAGRAGGWVCPLKWESRPATSGKKQISWDKRAARHANCKGCKQQLLDDEGRPTWSKDTHALKAAVTAAYAPAPPPLTEPKKNKTTGKMTGGGQVAISRHVLQDSQNVELEDWSSYNEWAALMAKDMPIFARGVVHTRIGMANTGRITSADPNALNFRRNSFFIGRCDSCGHEEELDPRELKQGKGSVVVCPECGK